MEYVAQQAAALGIHGWEMFTYAVEYAGYDAELSVMDRGWTAGVPS